MQASVLSWIDGGVPAAYAWLLATFAFFFFSFFPSSIDMRREVSWLGGAKLLDETNILFAILIEWIKFVDNVDRCGIR